MGVYGYSTVYNGHLLLLLFFLIILINKVISKEICENLAALCHSQKNCEDCIRVHHCCNWCYKKNFSGVQRCDIKHELNLICDDKIIKNNHSGWYAIQNDKFTNVVNFDGDFSDFIQMKPQRISVKLRKEAPLNITIYYKATKNYPLDLYYLMDLTWSMRKDLNTTTQLGLQLTKVLNQLTKNYRIAFGSYMDKTAMPFYMTDPKNYENPCQLLGRTCSKGYLFKHKLNFTGNIQKFIQEVKSSHLSANVDNLEGGLDALMQILLCNDQMEWSENARKIVIITTESAMHLAGDGLLAGAILRNRQCLIDMKGNYVSSLNSDYPSLEEIHRQLKRRKINLIFAAKNESLPFYKALHDIIPESTFIGRLEVDSTNILDLVREGYYDFIKRVSLISENRSDLNINFYADCYGNGYLNKTNTCWNVEEGKPIKFLIELNLKKFQDKQYDQIIIEERNLQQKIHLDLEYLDNRCNCSTIKVDKNCINGKFICGNCSCHEGWSGEFCDIPCETNIDKCRYRDQNNRIYISCFGNGDCICGKCSCYYPFTGKYCRYESCPTDKINKKICGGPARGVCLEGKCICESSYTGEDCSCLLSQENCKIPNKSTICNDQGECICNRCYCAKGYEGQFCEICSDCEGLCNDYLSCTSNFILNLEKTCLINKTVLSFKWVESILDEKTCYYRYNLKEEYCEVKYKYTIKRGGLVDLEIEKPQCYVPVAAEIKWTSIILGILLGGFLILLIWRLRATYIDKIEYKKFLKESQNYNFGKGENPLYKSPITEYKNPIEMVDYQNQK